MPTHASNSGDVSVPELPAPAERVKDYAVNIRIKNNWFLTRMKAAGFRTVAELSRATGIDTGQIGGFVNLKRAPQWTRSKDYRWKSHILRIAEALHCLPEDLFPPQHLSAPLKRNTATIELAADELPAVIGQFRQLELPPDAPHDRIDADNTIKEMLALLPPREERVLRRRYGIDCEPGSLEEIGKEFGITRERVRQIEAKAVRRFKDPGRAEEIRDALLTIIEQET
jgi:RNA polymerase sigma factor (sigma-70 family)